MKRPQKPWGMDLEKNFMSLLSKGTLEKGAIKFTSHILKKKVFIKFSTLLRTTNTDFEKLNTLGRRDSPPVVTGSVS